jgi:hypothetical protein
MLNNKPAVILLLSLALAELASCGHFTTEWTEPVLKSPTPGTVFYWSDSTGSNGQGVLA